MKQLKLVLASAILFSLYVQGQNADYSVFQVSNSKSRKWIAFRDNDELLYKTISAEVFRLLDEREKKISGLHTQAEWEDYRKGLREKLFTSLDKFKKTPLNAQVTGIVKRKGLKIEKILFESHPGFYVTGCLFIPQKRQKPAPAVIYVSGHTSLSFRDNTYQRVILNLVKKGFIVFAIDPIGQGERLQYPDAKTGKSKIGGPTTEHSYAGAQTLLTGTSLSAYFIWDGVRAVDYLSTRKEVDMKRIGITGRSGGGTQTAMIAAYDDRILAAAPECYITNFRRLFQSIGPQDAEQNPWHAIEEGFDFPDYFHLRAPKPSLIVTTTLDFFSQQGARETFREAQLSYSAMGKPGNIKMIEDFGTHESTRNNREAVYAFFQRALNLPGDSADEDVQTFSQEELQVTRTGQVVTSLNSKTVFDLNKEYFSRDTVENPELRATVKKISGMEEGLKLKSVVFTGLIPVKKYNISKYFLENEKNEFALPVWVAGSAKAHANKIIVWLNPEGKEKVLEGSLLNKLIETGFTVISADMPGTGELFDPSFKGDGFVKNVPFNYTFGAQLAGKSIPGIIADNINLLMQFVSQINTDGNPVYAFAEKEMCSPLMHFTALKDPFSKIVFYRPLASNKTLIEEKFYDPKQAYYAVPGSLPFYDVDDLLSLIKKNTYLILDPVSASGSSQKGVRDDDSVIEFFRK